MWTLLSNWKQILFAVLLVLTLGFGYASYSLYGTNATLKTEIAQLHVDLAKEIGKRQDAENSHKTTLDELDALDQQNKLYDTGLQRDLLALCRPAKATPQGDNNEHVKTLPSVPRDGRLDPELVRLLDRAYCEGNRNDLRCSAEGNDQKANSQ